MRYGVRSDEFAGEGHKCRGVVCGGDYAGEEIVEREDYAGGVDAWMAGIEFVGRGFSVKEILVNDEVYVRIRVVYQAHWRYGAGINVKIFHHGLFRREGESCASQLRGEIFGLERLVGRNHEQIELRLLLVREEQILEYRSADGIAHSLAFLHRESRGVDEGGVFHAQTVKKIVDGCFGSCAFAAVGGTSLVKMHVSV